MGICYMTQGTQTGFLWQSTKVPTFVGEGDGWEVLEGGNMGIPMADYWWCMTENHKIL